jgi:hypothetical protein
MLLIYWHVLPMLCARSEVELTAPGGRGSAHVSSRLALPVVCVDKISRLAAGGARRSLRNRAARFYLECRGANLESAPQRFSLPAPLTCRRLQLLRA